MRVYFIFDLKDEFVSLYSNNLIVLFNILKKIYYLNDYDINYGFNLFNQLTNRIDKNKLDRYLYLKLHGNIPYSKRGDVHIYNNLYKDEISRLIVKKSYMKLETEQSFSTFFGILGDYKSNYFVCDFKYQDYYFLQNCSLTSVI